MNELPKLAQDLSTKSSQYLFLLTLLVLGLFGLYVMRQMLSLNNELRKENTEMHARWELSSSSVTVALDRSSRSMDANTIAMNANTSELARAREIFDNKTKI